ncbi:ribosome biogenesis GTPase YlqF [Mycoplasmopsis columbina]|uniref:ribosome biogenesis GTPase YlqF n=1 Tax=Mycoplasmopsis columbina TaxID=114881 RepID=UPI0004A73A17|nr:ribosome biogenesis GTPase YlqF [Mycoplasmopsis columbina]VEU77187.1 GTPase [Mycoplasmopsis columbina]
MSEEKTLINWYPGHMAKGMREIKENASIADVFIIVLDARCPISSYNEDFDAIAPHKPRLFVITKSDLMDSEKKNKIQQRFKDEKVLWLDLRKNKSREMILSAIKKATKEKVQRDKEKGFLISKIRIFVLGVPNAGKSTLINLMSQKKSLKVANQPGVTRAKKWVAVDNYYFMDTPGILLPKLSDQIAATKLAMIGSIETNIFPLRFLANNYLKVIAQYYPSKFETFFNVKLEKNNDLSDIDAYNIFSQIAINKGYKINNKPDLTRIYKIFNLWVRDLKGVTYD